MKQLNPNWLTEGLIDFEYKKYMVLAYLQDAQKWFDDLRLYPILTDLLFHYQNLLEVRENKQMLYDQFPKQISKADFEKLQLAYKKIVEDDQILQAIEEIVTFAVPKFEHLLRNGKEVYEFVESKVEISPVGITPIYSDEGYMFLNEYQQPETQIYQYQITVFQNTHEKFRGLNVQFVETVRKSLSQTYENLKISLIRKYTHLPNPATFIVLAHTPCPLQETLLPVAKRALVRYLSAKAA